MVEQAAPTRPKKKSLRIFAGGTLHPQLRTPKTTGETTTLPTGPAGTSKANTTQSTSAIVGLNLRVPNDEFSNPE